MNMTGRLLQYEGKTVNLIADDGDTLTGILRHDSGDKFLLLVSPHDNNGFEFSSTDAIRIEINIHLSW